MTEDSLLALRRSLAARLGKVPSNVDIIATIGEQEGLAPKPTRSLSGVNVVAIMTKPIACPHGKCTYCPGGPGSVFGDVPQSYTGNEPASMRAIRARYDAYLQVMSRLEQYAAMGRLGGKVELIIMGGTFPSFDAAYQDEFITDAFAAMNDFSRLFFKDGAFDRAAFNALFELPASVRDQERVQRVFAKLKQARTAPTLEQAQAENEHTQVRCVALCIETKPDWCLAPHVDQMLRLGTTRVELGVQTLSEEVLKRTNRGHTLADTIESVRAMKDAFLKVGFHMMPGQPGSTIEEDEWMLREIFDNQNYRPDALKIYPCMVMPGTPLYEQYRRGEFEPMGTRQAAELLARVKPHVPEYCRIMRIQRDIPTKVTADGVDRTNLRQYVEGLLGSAKCRCIRCREPRGKAIDASAIEMRCINYESSGGKEVFLSFVDAANDYLLGYCRVRLPGAPTRPEITPGTAGIRELHVFGHATPVGAPGNLQHTGLGSKLVAEAERIARDEWGARKLLVIAGVGARDYYARKLGYVRDGAYMAKELS